VATSTADTAARQPPAVSQLRRLNLRSTCIN
jgi:hypothetical protein